MCNFNLLQLHSVSLFTSCKWLSALVSLCLVMSTTEAKLVKYEDTMEESSFTGKYDDSKFTRKEVEGTVRLSSHIHDPNFYPILNLPHDAVGDDKEVFSSRGVIERFNNFKQLYLSQRTEVQPLQTIKTKEAIALKQAVLSKLDWIYSQGRQKYLAYVDPKAALSNPAFSSCHKYLRSISNTSPLVNRTNTSNIKSNISSNSAQAMSPNVTAKIRIIEQYAKCIDDTSNPDNRFDNVDEERVLKSIFGNTIRYSEY